MAPRSADGRRISRRILAFTSLESHQCSPPPVRSTPIRRADSPLRYWLATAFNVAVVLLFALAAVFILRAGAMRLGLH